MISTFSGCIKRNPFLPLMNICSRTPYRSFSSPTDAKVYNVTFQVIDQRDVKNIPASDFSILDAKKVGENLELTVQQYSQEDPEIKACWIGTRVRGADKLKIKPKDLHVYLTGGKADKPRKVTSNSSQCAKLIELNVNLNLALFAQLIKQKKFKLDKDAEVVFQTISPAHGLHVAGIGKLKEEVPRAYHEFLRMKFSDLIASAK